MRFIYILFALMPIVISDNTACKKSTAPGNCLKGKLEIKGICSNYVITILEGDYDKSKVAATWTDPQTQKTYQHAFKLGSPCTFPATLNEGDTFYFEFVAETKEDCAVCMAYRPVPEQVNMIRVLDEACSN